MSRDDPRSTVAEQGDEGPPAGERGGPQRALRPVRVHPVAVAMAVQMLQHQPLAELRRGRLLRALAGTVDANVEQPLALDGGVQELGVSRTQDRSPLTGPQAAALDRIDVPLRNRVDEPAAVQAWVTDLARPGHGGEPSHLPGVG